MWEEMERSPVLAAPGSNDYCGLIASSTYENSGSVASSLQGLTDEEANDLCERYLPLAYKMAGQYGDKGISLDERRSAAFDGLVLASRKYDPKRGPFGPYAKLWIKGEITALLKDAKRHRAKSLADPAFKDDDDGENFLERFVIDESAAFNPDVSDLTAKERRIILGRVSGETLSETGKALDLLHDARFVVGSRPNQQPAFRVTCSALRCAKRERAPIFGLRGRFPIAV